MRIKRQRHIFAKILLTLLLIVVVGGLGALAAWQFMQGRELKNQVASLQSQLKTKKTELTTVQQQVAGLRTQLVAEKAETPLQTQQRIAAEVAQLYAEAPKKEQPTIVQVQDPAKLADQPFFKDAAVADYVVVYPKSKVAVLYRAAEKKIINAGPVTIAP